MILAVVVAFNCKNLLISEQHSLKTQICDQTFHDFAFLEPLLLHSIINEMGFVDLVTSESQLPFDYIPDAALADSEL